MSWPTAPSPRATSSCRPATRSSSLADRCSDRQPDPIMHVARFFRPALPALLALLLATVPAAAAEWQAKVRAAQEVGFTDDVAFSTKSREASPTSVTSGEAELTGRNAR